MNAMYSPKTPKKLIPIMRDVGTRKLVDRV
jgi:hypothetical protein